MWQEFNIGKSENSITSWSFASHNNNAANHGHTSIDYELPTDTATSDISSQWVLVIPIFVYLELPELHLAKFITMKINIGSLKSSTS
jgi:hypothetical protein